MAERSVPLFSIGAVGRMLDLSAATIRTWETRYGYIVPQRSQGGQRLYSRDQVDQLRLVKEQIAAGRRPGEAHRLLAERVERGDSFGGTRLRVLLVENTLGTAALLEQLFGPDAFEVLTASDSASAEQAFNELSPGIVIIDIEDSDFEQLAERIRATGVKVLPVGLLERPLSLLDPAQPALR
jgi:DNA-binding transcriptional MerR regulator